MRSSLNLTWAGLSILYLAYCSLISWHLVSSVHYLYLCPTNASLYQKPWNFCICWCETGILHFRIRLRALPASAGSKGTHTQVFSILSKRAAFCNSCCWVCSDDGGCYKAVGGLFLGYLFLHVTHLLPSLSPQIAANYSLGYSSAGAGWLF